jgi:hypothetical protein
MAEDQTGMRKDYLKELAPWTTLFSAFKIALDPKKLILAGTGLLAVALGWFILSYFLMLLMGKKPEFTTKDYPDKTSDKADKREASWQAFKRDRQKWNLAYEMAGSAPTLDRTAKPAEGVYDAADLADTLQQYEAIEAELQRIDTELKRYDEPIHREKQDTLVLVIGGKDNQEAIKIAVKPTKEEDRASLQSDLDRDALRIKDLKIVGKGENAVIYLGRYELKPLDPTDAGTKNALEKAQQYKQAARTVEDIRAEASADMRNLIAVNKALELRTPRFKPYGLLRTLPWFENRGANPYFLVSGSAESAKDGSLRDVAWGRGFVRWLVGDEIPVLLEPLVKFFRPIIYLFDPAGGFWNRVFLFLVILWELAVWALFGGAITRIASVQVARSNERVGLMESLKFVWARYRSYFCAPLFPLLFLIGIAFLLLIFGLVEAWGYFIGDILSVLWPLVFLAGLIMAVVLVGLVGFPLMYSTISAEGSDSFDAISRSYSYVYQAPWHYIWYSVVALIYGAAVVFFIGFMGSLLVYLSKWGATLPPTTQSREPSYLFMWAPTSYGWRDMMLYKSPHAEQVPEVNNSGNIVYVTQLKTTDNYTPEGTNYFATFVVTVCLYVLFLLVVGFAYSYFWTASTIIYLLMRRKVDDTELDEIHLEEEPEQAWTPPPTTPAAPEPAKQPPPQMVESPMLRTPAPPPAEPPVLHTPPPPEPAPTPPAAIPESPPPHADNPPPPDGSH